MQIIKTKKEIRELAAAWKAEGFSVGLVPTMGYLHEGHKSLIRASAAQNKKTIVSIFVNPIQFGPAEDLKTYPRDMQRDAAACAEAGADVIFAPEANEMYAADFTTLVEVGGVGDGLCGASRPGHFKGVATVVCKLFNITGADRAYFGEKDFQQLAVIKRMTRDLDIDVEVIACKIVREADGLAMSSRNSYLSADERTAATALYKSLLSAEKIIKSGEINAANIEYEIKKIISAVQCAKIDYVKIVNADTLNPPEKISGRTLIALAVFIGKTRLIDNLILEA